MNLAGRGYIKRLKFFLETDDNIYKQERILNNKGEYMELEEAIKIVSPGDPYLKNMIRALSVMSLLNTEEENRRLEAAKLVLKNKRRIKYDGSIKGYVILKGNVSNIVV